MKKTLTILIFVFYTQFLFSQTECDSIRYRGKPTNVFVNNKKDGQWVYSRNCYNPTIKNIDSIINYKQSIKHGPSEYFFKGLVKKRLNFTNGLLDGKQVYWYGGLGSGDYQISKIDIYNKGSLVDSKRYKKDNSLKFDIGFVNLIEPIDWDTLRLMDSIEIAIFQVVSIGSMERKIYKKFKVISFDIGNIDCAWRVNGKKIATELLLQCPEIWRQFYFNSAICETGDGIKFNFITDRKIIFKK